MDNKIRNDSAAFMVAPLVLVNPNQFPDATEQPRPLPVIFAVCPHPMFAAVFRFPANRRRRGLLVTYVWNAKV